MKLTSENLTLHTDKYQINMMYAHWLNGTHNMNVVFEAFFRKLPFQNGYAVFAGLQRIVEYIQNLHFTEDMIRYLKEQEENYEAGFLEELRRFRFNGTLLAMEEGSVVFQDEPLIRVEGRVFEAQLVETAILNFMNYQTLIATKAARIKAVAPDSILLEFGTRRAQEADAAIWGSRAAYISGFDATSNVHSGLKFGIPTKGTHAHAWVQSHETEEAAFMRFVKALPDTTTLLVDTYDTLKSGVPNAIKAGQYLESIGKRLGAIRLDSGDLAYLSIKSREMLDQAGLNYVKISASNDLDENTIFNLRAQGAKIDIWGVGTQLITAADQPSLGGVYKLAAREQDGAWIPTIKISGNPEKVTTPGIKNVYRILSRETGKAIADYISLHDETEAEEGKRIKLFDPVHPYIYKYAENYEALPLLKTIFLNGELIYNQPDLTAIRAHHKHHLTHFWPEYLRKMNPEKYPVDFSTKAWELKMQLIKKNKL